MESYREKQVLPETISQKLAKRPLLLIVLTASVSFGVQLIPFRTVSSSLHQSFNLLQESTYQFRLQESFQQLLTPHVLLAFVCFAILFILYTSQQDKGESKFEDQNNSLVVEPKRGLLYRTTTMGQSIFAHLIPQAEDQHILSSGDAIASFDQGIPLDKQADTDDTVMSNVDDSASTRSEKKPVKSAPKNIPLPSTRASRTNNKKLSCPATSTGFASKDRSKLDPKLNYIPKSFREDPLKLDKEELNRKFESYLGNVRRQLELQKQESLLAKQLHPELKDLKQSTAPELKDLKRESTQSTEPSPILASLSFNDGSFNKGEKDKELPKPEVNVDLSEAELNERIDSFLSSYEDGSNSKREISETTTPQQRKWHSNSYSATRSMNSAAIETPTPDLMHSSSQITRGDSLTIDNQKFESFLQNFRNELRLQKQKSNLRYQLHLADDV